MTDDWEADEARRNAFMELLWWLDKHWDEIQRSTEIAMLTAWYELPAASTDRDGSSHG